MGDRIESLPIDKTVSFNSNDLKLIDALFRDNNDTDDSKKSVKSELKSSLVGGVLFAFFSSNVFDKILRSSGCTTDIYVWIMKIVCFMIAFYILKDRF